MKLLLPLAVVLALPVSAQSFRARGAVTSVRGAVGATRVYWGKGVEAALPANAAATNETVFVNSVSCPSDGNCTAVGSYTGHLSKGLGLLLSETAGKWAAGVEAALPGNASATQPGVSLNSVSCGSARNCTAVGAYNDSSGNREGLLLTETGGRWATGVEATLPPGADTKNEVADLESVSCASAGDCTAVGSYTVGGVGDVVGYEQGLLLTEAAGRWSPGDEAALPANAASTVPDTVIGSVSCPSAGNCTAVGSYRDRLGNSEGLLLTEKAGSWATGLEADLPANAQAEKQFASLDSVSCGSAGNCSAVGTYTDASSRGQGLLLTETAGNWATGVEAALPRPPKPGINPYVSTNSVSCASAGNCTAVGTYQENNADTQGVLLTETAGNWAPGLKAPLPANADTTVPAVLLNSVSCISARNCTAVGTYDSTGDSQGEGLLLTETAGHWAAGFEAVLPANAGNSWPLSINSVSCPSASNCSAVGTYGDNSGHQHGLLLVGSGTSVPKPCMVPKLKREHLDLAERSIRSHNCSVGPVTHEASRTIKKGYVISQKPKPGRRLRHGAKVSMVVSKGP